MADWRQLTGKAVRVMASGVEYRGVVVELGETAVLLHGLTGAVEIPWERVTSLEEDPNAPSGVPDR
jgi:autotransporter translocation and assembly factor TamB